MDEIQNWLSTAGDYQTGVSLYAQYGSNETLKRTFERGKNTYSSQKLKDELQRILAQGQAVAKIIQQEAKPQPRTYEKIETSNADVKALEAQWRSLYAECSYWHASLAHFASDQERGEKALLILQNFEVINEIWDKLEYFKQHQRLPDALPQLHEELNTLDGATLEKMRRNLIANISHARAGRKRAENIPIWEARKEAIESILFKRTHDT